MKKKENLIIALLIIVLIWLSVITWFLFNQDKTIQLHEFYLKEILQKL